MPTLPTTTVAFTSSATEADFKTFLSGQRAFLAGLLGTDGTAATAKSTLGVNDGVTSINGNSGAITASQIAAAATAGYGYTPANSAHTHSDYVSANMTHGAVGSVCFAIASPDVVAPGGTLAGANLKPYGINSTGGSAYPAVFSGTWRCLGYCSASGTLWQRIS